MGSLLDLLQTGQLTPSGLPPELEQILQLAQRKAAAQAAPSADAPGIAVGPAPMGMAPQPTAAVEPSQTQAPAPAPTQAAGPPQGTPAPQPAPPTAPARLPPRDFAERLRDAGRAVGMNLRDEQGQNQTYAALREKGLDDAAAKLVMSSPATLSTAIGNLLAPGTQVVNNKLIESKTGRIIADFSDSARNGPDVKNFELNGEKASAVWNPKTQRFEVPDLGIKPPENVTLPPGANTPEGRKKYATDMADATAKARTSLPEAIRASEYLTKSIDDVLNHPALKNVVGPIAARTWTINPESRDAEAKIAQIQGQTFLQAYNNLRGAGAISNAEGQKATEAFNRLSELKTSDARYTAALTDFRNEVAKLADIARKKAAGDFSAPTTSGWTELGSGVRIRKVQ